MKMHRFVLLMPLMTGNVPVQALDADTTGVTSPALDEIVVTARKRAEDLQSVPVAVSAFQGKFLDEQFTSTVSDLQKFTPMCAYSQSSTPAAV